MKKRDRVGPRLRGGVLLSLDADRALCAYDCVNRVIDEPIARTRSDAMDMPVTTTFTIEGCRIKAYKGVARDIIVRAPTITQGFLGRLKSIVGGNIDRLRQDVRTGAPAGLRRAAATCAGDGCQRHRGDALRRLGGGKRGLRNRAAVLRRGGRHRTGAVSARHRSAGGEGHAAWRCGFFMAKRKGGLRRPFP